MTGQMPATIDDPVVFDEIGGALKGKGRRDVRSHFVMTGLDPAHRMIRAIVLKVVWHRYERPHGLSGRAGIMR